MKLRHTICFLLPLILSTAGFRVSSQTIESPSEVSSSPDTAANPSGETGQLNPYLEAKQPKLMEEPVEERAEKEALFFWITVAPEIGYLFFPRSSLAVADYTAKVEPRNGFIAKLHFDMGGDGLAVEIAPLFAIEAGGINPSGGSFGNIGVDLSQGLTSGTFQAIGGQFAVVYRFEVGRFFPSVGLGFHGDYLWGNEIEYGTELYGRVPLGFTLYMGKDIGLAFDIGLMYGVTGIKTPFKLPESVPADIRAELDDLESAEEFRVWYEDPQNQAEIEAWLAEYQSELPENYDEEQLARDFVADQIAESIRFGPSFGIDISIGLRFP